MQSANRVSRSLAVLLAVGLLVAIAVPLATRSLRADQQAIALSPGDTITITCETQLSGVVQGQTSTVECAAPPPADPTAALEAPAITGLSGIQDGQTVSGVVAIEALVSGAEIVEVVFALDGPQPARHTEKVAPYFFKGDNDGQPNGWDAGQAPDGDYTLTVTATDRAGQSAAQTVRFRVDNGAEAAPPAAPPAGDDTGTGLLGAYYDAIDFTERRTTRTDPSVAFDWGGGAPAPDVEVDTFSVRWSGTVQPRYSEAYTFSTLSDDGVRLWVNGQLLIDNWTDHGVVEDSGTVELEAGQWYDLKLEYYEGWGGASVSLLWASPSQPREVIPQSRLAPAPGPAPEEGQPDVAPPEPTPPAETQPEPAPPEPTPPAAETQPEPAPPVQANPPAGPPVTLLSSYVIRPYPEYAAAQYAPRSVTVEPYAGWDLLRLPGQAINDGINTTLSNADWLTLELNRPATLAIVWRGYLDPPAWLQGWTRAADISLDGHTYPTFRNVVQAGTVTLGAVNQPGVGASQATYLVLFAEADGTPPAAPPVPSGKETPTPNRPCPGWVHDQYVTTAPDGKVYPTWHRQIDPVYWCYFEHEHGSDPSLFLEGYRPAYGYTASAHGMVEPHPGFKSYAFDDDAGHRWLITHHFGTGSIRRACARFHTLDIAVADGQTNQLVADLRLMGDFGKSEVNASDEALEPPECADQGTAVDAEGSTGVRKLPVATRGGVAYEPWRLDDRGNVVGLKGAALTFNTPSAIVICNDLSCDQPVATGSHGAFRFFSFDTGFGIQAGANVGEFFTDMHARARIDTAQPGAVRQFVEPGLNITLQRAGDTEECYPLDPWRMPYRCMEGAAPIESDMNLEGALKGAN